MTQLTCAQCGIPMKRMPASLPQGLATCHPCRRGRPSPCRRANPARPKPTRTNRKLAEKTCEQCGQHYKPWRQDSRYCSHACSCTARRVRTEDDLRVKRQQREQAAPGLTAHQRSQLLRAWKQQGKRCGYCLTNKADTADHIIPLARGGTNHEGNLAPCCRSCNSSKGARLLIEWKHGKAAAPMAMALPWITVQPKVRKPKPKRTKTLRSCSICYELTTNKTTCSDSECQTERTRRLMRDRYRAAHGLPVDPTQPTSKWTNTAAHPALPIDIAA